MLMYVAALDKTSIKWSQFVCCIVICYTKVQKKVLQRAEEMQAVHLHFRLRL